MKRFIKNLVRSAMVVMAFAPIIATVPAYAAPSDGTSMLSAGHTTSHNWSGYTASDTTFSEVSGEFTIPKATCTGPYAESLFWVGFDSGSLGASRQAIEQDGLEELCGASKNSAPSYFGFWEMYPSVSQAVPIAALNMAPGDKVAASVTYSASTRKFTLSVRNLTNGRKSKLAPQKCAAGYTCSRTNAEWIAERASVGVGQYVSMAEWNDPSKIFSDDRAATSARPSVLEPISHFAHLPIDMDTRSGKYLAVVGGLRSGGTAFTDTWKGAE